MLRKLNLQFFGVLLLPIVLGPGAEGVTTPTALTPLPLLALAHLGLFLLHRRLLAHQSLCAATAQWRRWHRQLFSCTTLSWGRDRLHQKK
jgi:hypothetical protein